MELEHEFLEQATLHSPDIKSAGDVSNIETALDTVDGVRDVEGDPNANTVTVTYDPDVVSVPAIEEAVQAAGYKLDQASVVTTRSNT